MASRILAGELRHERPISALDYGGGSTGPRQLPGEQFARRAATQKEIFSTRSAGFITVVVVKSV
jgi:hypothetical protein